MPERQSSASPQSRNRKKSYSSYTRTSYSDSYSSDYSDSFYSDASDKEDAKQKPKQQTTFGGKANKPKAQPTYGRGGRGMYNPPKPIPSRRPGGMAAGGGGRLSRPVPQPRQSPRENSDAMRRMLSARKLKINELRNEIEDLHQQIHDLQQENKTLKRQNVVRERALVKYEDQEQDVPYMIQKHGEELRAAREQGRKHKDRANRLEKKLKDTDDELMRAQRQIKKMRGIIEDKNLGERDELSRKLTKAEGDVDEKDKRIHELERHLEHLQKNHKHELGIERARHRETQRKLQELDQAHQRIQNTLKEKEKELDVRNIYSNRLIKAPFRLGSTSSSPAPAGGQHSGPGTHRPGKGGRKKSDPQHLTPRQRAKLFEHKRKDEERRMREPRQHTDPGFRSHSNHSAGRYRLRSAAHAALLEASIEDRSDTQLTQGLDADDTTMSDPPLTSAREQRRQELLDMEELQRREEERRKLKEMEEREEQLRKENVKKEEQERLNAERERIKHESEERRLRIERERKESEQREQEERLRRQQQERENREREEKERKAKEEQERQEQEAREQEEREDRERREKQEQEEREERERLEKERLKKLNSEEERERQKQKALLLAKMKEMDSQKEASDDMSPESRRKSYTFTRPVENMHQGKPAYDELSSDRSNKRNGFLDGNAYQPTFTTADTAASKKRNSSLMADLFGTPASTSKNHNAASSSTNSDHIESLFDDKPSGTSGGGRGRRAQRAQARESSVTELFGGGSAIIEDSSSRQPTPPTSGNPNHLLPRRPRQTHVTTFQARPTVNAIDDIDDDLEEMTL